MAARLKQVSAGINRRLKCARPMRRDILIPRALCKYGVLLYHAIPDLFAISVSVEINLIKRDNTVHVDDNSSRGHYRHRIIFCAQSIKIRKDNWSASGLVKHADYDAETSIRIHLANRANS